MEIKLIAAGTVKEDFYRRKIEQLQKEIQKKMPVRLICVKDDSIPKHAGAAECARVKAAEGERILRCIDASDYVAALCIDGCPQDGGDMEKLIQKAREREKASVTFVIGGSLGLSEAVIRRADVRISFSDMTFPHQLMRVMLLSVLADVICDR